MNTETSLTAAQESPSAGSRVHHGLTAGTKRVPESFEPRTCDLSVLIPSLHEAENLQILLPQLKAILDSLGARWEVFLLTQAGDTEALRVAHAHGVGVVVQAERGYGGALIAGIQEARGRYILTMDADLSHPPTIVEDLWRARDQADVLVASRYTPGGSAIMPWSRFILSRILNGVFARGLGLKIRDMSSGFRLFRAEVLIEAQPTALDFDICQELLVKAYAGGWSVREIPYRYEPRRHGSSHARVLRFGIAYARTFWRLWRYRNSIQCADYDDRAYNSPIPFQRYWQRQRFRHVTELLDASSAVLDVGCGSSRILGALPLGSVGLDPQFQKLRHDRKYGVMLIAGSGFCLPFPDNSFSSVLCSQVIEHVPKDSPILRELCRVLAPGGTLVLGTPDYARWEWVLIERIYGLVVPGGYEDEHISHYTANELVGLMCAMGLHLLDQRYILRGELIQLFRKGVAA